MRDLTPGDLILGHDGAVRPAWIRVLKIRARHHRGRIVRVDTSSGGCLRVTSEHRVLSRFTYTNRYHDLVLMERVGVGFSLGLANGQLRDVTESRFLYTSSRTHPSIQAGEERDEKVWLLLSMKEVRRAQFTSRVLGLRYGLPSLSLDPRMRSQEHPPAFVRRLQEKVDTHARGRRMIGDFGHRVDDPHFTMRALDALTPGNPRLLTIDEFTTTPEGGRPVHRLCAIPLKSASFQRDRLISPKLRQLSSETRGSRAEVDTYLNEEGKKPGTDVSRRVQVTALKTPFFEWSAAHLREASLIPACEGWGFENESIDRVILEEYDGEVYGLVTEDSRPISAAGLLVGGDDV